jgi:putative redox protein
MKVTLKQISGLALAAVADSGHWVITDGPAKFGGYSAGPRPMELLLMSLATCTGMDIVSILRKKRVKLDDFTVEVEAEQAPEHPKVFTKIKLHFTFIGDNIRATDVERALELSENKYCSVSAMLKAGATISRDYKIIERDQRPADSPPS